MLRILGVNGSPYKEGITSILLKSVLDGAKREGATTDVIHLYDHRIEHAPGLYSEDPTREVITKMPEDDMRQSIFTRVQEADGLVLATPCYWANMSGARSSHSSGQQMCYKGIHYK